MIGLFEPLPDPLTLYIDWLGESWRVTLPAPNYYTRSSRARWERLEPES